MTAIITSEFLKLRSDLAISQQKTGESMSFVIKEPASGRFFRFGEIEGYLLEQLDGTRSLEELQEGAQKRFDASLPLETLQQFVQRLGRLGLLEGSQEPRREAVPQRRIRGSLFYLRLRAF